MNRPNRHFKLGLFVLFGVGLLVAAVVVLGAGKLFASTIPAETFMDESVNGLDVGSAVKYRGVTIGRVSGISFAAYKYGNGPAQSGADIAKYIVVEMSLDAKAFPGMGRDEIGQTLARMATKGLRARVATAGISGQAYIEVDFLDPALYPPPEISWTPRQLYIPSAPSTMGQVVSAVDRLAIDLQQANLAKVVRNMDTLVTQATATIQSVNRVVEGNEGSLKSAVADLPDVTGRLKSASARADEVLHDKRIEQLLASLSDDGAQARQAVADLRGLIRQVQTLVASQGDDVRAIVSDLRKMSADLAAVAQDARDNPSRLLLGQPPPRKRPGE